MKKIEAIIRDGKLKSVEDKLEEVGIVEMTVEEVKGRGRQKGITGEWGDEIIRLDTLSKIKIGLVVDDKDLEKAIAAIIEGARTNNTGDGKIFVYQVEDAVRIRTGEHGKEAI